MGTSGAPSVPSKVKKIGDMRFRESYITSGTDVNRPSLGSNDTGFVYFDTTISAPISWDGTNWISPLKLAVCNNDAVICSGDEIITII